MNHRTRRLQDTLFRRTRLHARSRRVDGTTIAPGRQRIILLDYFPPSIRPASSRSRRFVRWLFADGGMCAVLLGGLIALPFAVRIGQLVASTLLL